jgi:MFS family permease
MMGVNQQVIFLLVQVFFVGLTLGMTRTIMPMIAETEFSISKNSFLFLNALIIAFGLVKAILNLKAGQWSERLGRKKVLIFGWLIAFPIPLIIYWAKSWYWLIFAMGLLGANQGITWSMTQTAKLDQIKAHQKGLVMGFNEFAGYMGMAIAGIWTADLSQIYGSRQALLYFGLIVIHLGLWMAILMIKESKPSNLNSSSHHFKIILSKILQNTSLLSVIQAGLVEKFVDALIWIVLPIYLLDQGLEISSMSRIVGLYGIVWGITQLGTGYLSDLIGRKWPIIIGMSICTIGVWMILSFHGESWWLFCAVLIGFGMALLYPTLSASVSDMTNPQDRGAMIGTYRFFRDLGLAIAGVIFAILMHTTQQIEIAFWGTISVMIISTLHLCFYYKDGHKHKDEVRQG